MVVYAPSVEGVMRLSDLYSTARRTAWLSRESGLKGEGEVGEGDGRGEEEEEEWEVDPTLLLVPSVQSSRVRRWQVLPGRTHPLMTGKGGAEGFVWTATRVLPVKGRVEARGHGKRGKSGGRVGDGDGEGGWKRRKVEGDVANGDAVDREGDVDIRV